MRIDKLAKRLHPVNTKEIIAANEETYYWRLVWVSVLRAERFDVTHYNLHDVKYISID